MSDRGGDDDDLTILFSGLIEASRSAEERDRNLGQSSEQTSIWSSLMDSILTFTFQEL